MVVVARLRMPWGRRVRGFSLGSSKSEGMTKLQIWLLYEDVMRVVPSAVLQIRMVSLGPKGYVFNGRLTIEHSYRRRGISMSP